MLPCEVDFAALEAEAAAKAAAAAAEEAAHKAREAAAAEARRPKALAPTAGILTSNFGPRWGEFHGGVDIAAMIGTPIVAVTDGARLLLGRQASWPARRYSTLAGFVEPGETLVETAVRDLGY